MRRPPFGSTTSSRFVVVVASLRVRRADIARPPRVGAEQPVDDRRLAHARRSEQRACAPAGQIVDDLLDPLARFRIEHVHGRIRGNRLRLGHPCVNVFANVRLRQQHHRRRPAFTCQQQIALEPPGAEVLVEAHDDERHVHIGRHHLLVGHVAGHPPRNRLRRGSTATILPCSSDGRVRTTTQSPTAGSSPRLVA